MKFNRLSILQFNGLFTKINSIKFENEKYFESNYLKIKSYVIFFLAASLGPRFPLSLLYDQNDSHQLFVGYLFNHLKSREILSILGILVTSWLTSLFMAFRYLNNNEEKLILMWLKMTGTITDNDQFKIIGISRKQNRLFWSKQNKFNDLFLLCFHIYFTILYSSFTLPLYFMRYDAKLWIFIINLIIVLIHYFIFAQYFLRILCFYSLFFIEIILFFCFKFDKLIEKLNEIHSIKSTKSNYNLKLNKLIYQFSYIYLETVKFNILFNKFIGLNYFHVFIFEFICVFAAIFGDMNLRIGMPILTISLFLLALVLPFYLSSLLFYRMQKAIFLLQNFTFKSITNHSNKRKINHINYIAKFNDGYVFQCFNLFPMNSNYAFNTGIQIIMNILLLIRISQILYY